MAWLLAAVILMALLELTSIASILPFMQLVANPEIIDENTRFNAIYHFFGFESHRSMLITAGFAMLVIMIISNAFGAFTNWLQYKFTWNVAHRLSLRLLAKYLELPYAFYLDTNSSDMRAKLLTEVRLFSTEALLPLVQFVARTLVIVLIFALLLIVDVKLAIIVLAALGGMYVTIYMISQSALRRLGKQRFAANQARFRTLNEALSGIKALKVYGASQFFFERFEKSSKELSDVQPKVQLITTTPKYLIEVLAFGGILTITLYLLVSQGNLSTALPLLSLYALAGYRLIPSLQRVFVSLGQLRHSAPVVDAIHTDLEDAPLSYNPKSTSTDIHLKQHIRFRQMTFSYHKDLPPVLDGIDLVIHRGTTVAFVGPTGAGKTTLIDIVVGLLWPTDGSVEVDGTPVTAQSVSAWQQLVGYVPQEVFLFDDTIKSNIAFGVAPEDIDLAQVRKAAKLARLDGFIETELPQGYETEIGERGIRLSGGQQQRLGLARALYRDPEVLVLDEATSALDGRTERLVIDALQGLADDLTVIIIAHRLSTIKHADCIYLLKDGYIRATGTYDQLIEVDDDFRELASLS